MSLSIVRPSDANEASGRPVRNFCMRIRGARAELSQADGIAVEAGDDVAVRARFERDVIAQAGRKASPALPVVHSFSGSAQAGDDLRYGGESD